MDSKKREFSITTITGTGMIVAIMLALNALGLGKIVIPPIGLTTLHIPVIIATLVLGFPSGLITGAVFGILSFYNAYSRPTLLSMPFQNMLFAIIPRICIAITVFICSKVLKWDSKQSKVKAAVLGVVGSVTNTVLVLGGMGIYYNSFVVEQMGIPADGLWSGLGAVAAMNGIPEAIFSALIVTLLITAWTKIKPSSKSNKK